MVLALADTRKSIGSSARSRRLLKEREGEMWRDLPTFHAGPSSKVESYPRDISSREAALSIKFFTKERDKDLNSILSFTFPISRG